MDWNRNSPSIISESIVPPLKIQRLLRVFPIVKGFILPFTPCSRLLTLCPGFHF
jgi:hypothetical protein